MKTRKFVIAQSICALAFLAAVMLTGCSTGQETAAPPRAAVSYPPSYPALVGYGDWIESQVHGWVWKPFVVETWQPYSFGHWVWSDQGWLWVGYEDFSYVVDHYGFWDNEGGLGWVWIPGNSWSPSRVRWYTSDGYVGWMPLAPPGGAVIEPWDPAGPQRWVVVPGNDFRQENIGRYRDHGAPPRNGAFTGAGPDVYWVRQRTGDPLAPIRIQTRPVAENGRGPVEVVLPDDERRREESHRDEVRRDALRPTNRPTRDNRDRHDVDAVTPPPPPPATPPAGNNPLPAARDRNRDLKDRNDRPRTDTPPPPSIDIRRDPPPAVKPIQVPVVKEPNPPAPVSRPVVKAPNDVKRAEQIKAKEARKAEQARAKEEKKAERKVEGKSRDKTPETR